MNQVKAAPPEVKAAALLVVFVVVFILALVEWVSSACASASWSAPSSAKLRFGVPQSYEETPM